MAMSQEAPSIRHPRWRTVLFSLLFVCGLGVVVFPQVTLDVCGCKNNPASLGNFDSGNVASFPPGTTVGTTTMSIPLPADGVLVFNNISLAERPPYVGGYGLTITFVRNSANTPVTILASGNVTIGQYVSLVVSGDVGVAGYNVGKGGLGGPGGFRGGDGAYQLVNFARMGGAGAGPGGGAGGNDYYYQNGQGINATFLSAPDLLPLIGGSGGGGGGSTSISPGCGAGGGGGGGGAILMAVDGTITINGAIVANGAAGGSYAGNPNCASSGGGGSGGVIRVLATTISGTGVLNAVGAGSGGSQGPNVVADGRVRLEALNNNLLVSQTNPIASRTPGPGPIVNPITPTVAITTVGGQLVPSPPQGGLGLVDLVLAAPGQTDIGLATSGVPTGTTVAVTVKPRVGGLPTVTNATLSNCDGNGACIANVAFNLSAGAYFVEARATFQTP